MKNLAVLADVAAVPSAYDAEALVSVLVGHLIQAGIPEPGLTRMMLDVVDELVGLDYWIWPGQGFPAGIISE